MPRLTKTLIERATCDPGKQITLYMDSQVKAFGVRVYASGSKYYFINPMINGQRTYRQKPIYEFATVEDARAWAINLRRRLRAGETAEEIEAAPKQQLQAPEFFELFLKEYSEVMKKSAATDRRYVNNFLIPAFKRKRIEKISANDLQELRNKITADGGRKHTANRVRSLFRKAWKWGQQYGHIDASLPDPARHVEKFREKPRDRYLKDEEIVRLFDELEREEPELYLAVELALATGCRKMETLAMQWSWIDFGAKTTIRIPETKNGTSHLVPLNERVAGMLRDRKSVSISPYVFPGRFEDDHRKDFKTAWKRVRDAAKIPDVRWHDLRRTVGTRMAQNGTDLYTIAKTLNHKSLASTQTYAKLSTETTRAALESIDRKRGNDE